MILNASVLLVETNHSKRLQQVKRWSGICNRQQAGGDFDAYCIIPNYASHNTNTSARGRAQRPGTEVESSKSRRGKKEKGG